MERETKTCRPADGDKHCSIPPGPDFMPKQDCRNCEEGGGGKAEFGNHLEHVAMRNSGNRIGRMKPPQSRAACAYPSERCQPDAKPRDYGFGPQTEKAERCQPDKRQA